MPDLKLPPNFVNALQNPAQPSVQLSQPFNDVQLVALIAGQLCAGNRGLRDTSAVTAAMEIVAEAIAHMQQGDGMAKLVDAAKKRLVMLTGPRLSS